MHTVGLSDPANWAESLNDRTFLVQEVLQSIECDAVFTKK